MPELSVGGRTLERVRREALRNGHQREITATLGLSALADKPGAKKGTREPQPIGDILGTFYANKAVAKKLLLPEIVEIWENLVGPLVAEHTMPKHLSDEVLHVSADSTVWAAQLSALNHMIVNKINEKCGPNSISKIKVTGPRANVPNYGPRTVKGSIGYRDTFG